jgi:hypothetical protein
MAAILLENLVAYFQEREGLLLLAAPRLVVVSGASAQALATVLTAH